jgi:hypothetical protein
MTTGLRTGPTSASTETLSSPPRAADKTPAVRPVVWPNLGGGWCAARTCDLLAPSVGRGFAVVRQSPSAQVSRHTERQRTVADRPEQCVMVVKMVVKKGHLDQHKRHRCAALVPIAERDDVSEGGVGMLESPLGINLLPDSGAGGSQRWPLPRRAPAPGASKAFIQLWSRCSIH